MLEKDERTSITADMGMTRRQFIGKICLAIPAIAILGVGLSGCEGDEGDHDFDRDEDGRERGRDEGRGERDEDRGDRDEGERR